MIDGILEFTFRPVADKRFSVGAFIISLALAAAAVVASVLAETKKGLISLAAVIVICYAIYLFTRYIIPEYAYAVVYDSEENPNFVVTKRIGKSVTTLFNMPLYEIYKIELETDLQRRKHTVPYGTQKFNFAPSLMAKSCYRIYAKNRSLTREFLIEGTSALAERLRSYSALALAQERREDEDAD